MFKIKYVLGCIFILFSLTSCENTPITPERPITLASGEGSGGVSSASSALSELIIGSYDDQTESYFLYDDATVWADAFETAISDELDLVAVFDSVHILDEFVAGTDTVGIALEGDIMSLEVVAVKVDGEYKALDFIKRECTPGGGCEHCKILTSGCPCKEDVGQCTVKWGVDFGGVVGVVLSVIALSRRE